MMPPRSHTGTPRHFHSSTTSGSASLISARTFASATPRQSPSSLMRPSIRRDGEVLALSTVALLAVVLVVAFFMSLTFVRQATGWLASPRRRVVPRRSGRPHGYRGSACPCFWTRREEQDAV